MNNRIWNIKNPYQGDAKKVLCVCSAGLLRSPTAANVLHQTAGFNTRAAGVSLDHALIPVDEVLLAWADEIVVMQREHAEALNALFGVDIKDVTILDIPDNFSWEDPQLKVLIKEAYFNGQ